MLTLFLVILSLTTSTNAQNCQLLTEDIAKRLPGWNRLLEHAKSLWGGKAKLHIILERIPDTEK
jgi:hypothetical protein